MSDLRDRLRQGRLTDRDFQYLLRHHPDLDLRQPIRDHKRPIVVRMGRGGVGSFIRHEVATVANGGSGRSITNGNSFSFPTAAISTADPNRYVVAIVGCDCLVAVGAIDFTSVLINSLPVTTLKNYPLTNTVENVALRAVIAHVPTGTTAAVDFLTSFNARHAVYDTFAVYNLNVPDRVQTENQTQSSSALAKSVNLNTRIGQILFACSYSLAGTDRTHVWSGVTEQTEIDVETTEATYSSGTAAITSDETPRSVSVTPSGNARQHVMSFTIY